MSRIAYLRVSTVEQNEARQREAIERFNIDKWFIEKASAKDTDRPMLKQLLEFLREGDCLYIKDFSRLARSVKDLLNIIEELDARQIKLISLSENLDTGTPTGRLLVTMIAAINEFERSNLLERQREGIFLAKQAKKYAGRKKIEKPDNWDEVYPLYKTRRITGTEAMNRLGLRRNVFYNFVAEAKGEVIANGKGDMDGAGIR